MAKRKIAPVAPRTQAPAPTPAAAEPLHHDTCVDGDLLLEARRKAFALVLATDGVVHGAGTYTYEEFDHDEVLRDMAHELSALLAELGKQAEEPWRLATLAKLEARAKKGAAA